METPLGRVSAAHRRRRPHRLGAALVLVIGFGLAACTAGQIPSPTPTSETDLTPSLPATAEMVDLDAGTYLVTDFGVPFEITVPAGWQSFGWGVLKEVSGDWQVFVNFLSPTSVPADACKWAGSLAEIEPTPDAYAGAMSAQTWTQTTAPVEVAVGDYSGLEFDYTVDSGLDFAECDEERVCLFADAGATTCTRVYGDALHRETERALDVEGELVMIAVGQFTEVDPALAAEARAVFDSIQFTSPGG